MSELTPPNDLIHALLLDGKGAASSLEVAQVDDWVPEQGCLWLHFNFEEPGAQRWLREASGLSDIAVNALISDETRPRSASRNDELILSLRGLNLSEGDDPADMISLRIWSDGKRVISTRRRALLSTQDLVERLQDGHGPRDAEGLLVAWIDRIASRMNETIEDFDDQVLALEEQVLGDETEGLRLQLSRLRRQSIAIRRYLAPQREAMNRLVTENLSWLGDFSRIQLRETTDRLIRYIEDLDEVRDRAALAQEELLSRVSEQLNQRSYVFTVVATIFLPLGFFTGLMGINVGGMPGTDSSLAFWIVVALCLVITGLLAVLFRMKRWL
jgi:zinc transporter